MKKKILCTFLSLLTYFAFSSSYQIDSVFFNIKGKTKQYSVEREVPVDTKRVFHSEEELKNYLNDYIVRLNNVRHFSDIDVQFKYENDVEDSSFLTEKSEIIENNLMIPESQDFSEETLLQPQTEAPRTEDTFILEADNSILLNKDTSTEDKITKVTLFVNLTDTNSFLALPYPKFDSNLGTQIKIKAKDTNFLGSLNPMGADINFQIKQEDFNAPASFLIGLNFSYDYPFKLGIIDSSWVNEYGVEYTFGSNLPEWNGKTGFKFILPEINHSYCLELYQFSYREEDYRNFKDDIFFKEQARFSVPITLISLNNLGDLIYTPYIDFIYNWDFDGINPLNDSLSSPTLSIGHSLQAGRVNWNDNMRKGFSATLNNFYQYNFSRYDFIPYVGLDLKGYFNFRKSTIPVINRLGICADLYSFIYIPSENHKTLYGEMIGSRLRGIRDLQFFSANTGISSAYYACYTSTATILSLDFPFHLFTTHFDKSFFKHLNFELQMSPFIDLALGYNRYTKRYYHPKDGFYSGGIEMLAYLEKWPSFTIRGSIGFDLGKILNFVEPGWRSEVSKYEISIGIGLLY